MKSKRQKWPSFVGPETSRVAGYALSGVAKQLARLLKRNLERRRPMLTRRGETGIPKRDVFRLLCRAFSKALLNPRGGDATDASRQRKALMFALAAADLPRALRVSGIPSELHRQRKRRRR
jgi:hypothetical protein